MNNKDIISLIEKQLQPIIKEHNYELVEVEFVKEASYWFLRIFIDVEKGITIEDCEIVTRYIGAILDELDPIEQSYTLEVSSPGIDRKLKKESDYIKYAGKDVDIKLFKSINKQKDFTGKLLGLKESIVTIEDETKNQSSFDLKDIASCRLAVKF